MKRLTGKVALVTGASRGIGRGSALCLAEEGADVVVNYRSHPDDAAEVAAAITAMGRKALVHQADVSDREAMEAMFEAAVSHFGHLDIVVANAAMSIRTPVIEAKWEDILRTIEVAQFGVFHACQLAAQQMVRQGLRGRSAGKIIIISSVHQVIPVPASAAYNMAKAAINHLGRTMAAELTEHHININVINPGWIDTPGERGYYTEEQIAEGAKKMPWKRLGTAEEIGKGVVYLASDDADYITGSTLTIDGGLVVSLSYSL